jgi:hypothetical protein
MTLGVRGQAFVGSPRPSPLCSEVLWATLPLSLPGPFDLAFLLVLGFWRSFLFFCTINSRIGLTIPFLEHKRFNNY